MKTLSILLRTMAFHFVSALLLCLAHLASEAAQFGDFTCESDGSTITITG